jgi:hypothetical protein
MCRGALGADEVCTQLVTVIMAGSDTMRIALASTQAGIVPRRRGRDGSARG